jgi:outer membrane murein-binding lipoprotein Lpp
VDTLATKGDILATKVDNLATKGDILATKVDNLATKGDILATKVDNLPTKLEAMMWNKDVIGLNRGATSDTDTIVSLKNDSGGRPADFPTTLGEFNRLNNDQITPFLVFYGLDRSRSNGSNLNRLKNHICGQGLSF